MNSSSNQRFLKWGALFFNFVVLVSFPQSLTQFLKKVPQFEFSRFFLQIVGPTLMALSLRVLFDPEFTHLFFQGGNYYVGHILVAIGALMTVTGILGCIGVLAENSCLLWMVNNF